MLPTSLTLQYPGTALTSLAPFKVPTCGAMMMDEEFDFLKVYVRGYDQWIPTICFMFFLLFLIVSFNKKSGKGSCVLPIAISGREVMKLPPCPASRRGEYN